MYVHDHHPCLYLLCYGQNVSAGVQCSALWMVNSGACEVGSPIKGQRGRLRSSGRYETHYEEEYYYEDEEGHDDSESRQRWPARSADGKFRVSHLLSCSVQGTHGANHCGDGPARDHCLAIY